MGGVDRTAASLRISGPTLVPAEVTRLLGHPPDLSYRKGEPIPLANGRSGAVARQGLWSIKAANAQPGNLDDQIAGLLDRVSGDQGVWERLSSAFRVDLFCGLFIVGGNQGLTISASTLLALGNRGIALDLDIYSHD